MSNIGKFVLQTSKAKGKSLNQLARESGVGRATLRQLTKGVFMPSPELLLRLAPHLDVTPRKLFEEAGWLKPKTAKNTKAKKK